jgi:sterol desaturase/sphingolipid hydroxylase (fatty acid hydroxylase superfamily)
MDIWVSNRLHPIDPAFTGLCGLVPVYALGLASANSQAGTITAIGLSAIGSVWHIFIHANTRVRLGFVEQVFTSPAFHHWHHSREDPIDRNYANLLPWLDRIFGTYYLPKKDWPVAYGLRDPISPNMVGQLIDPLIPPASFMRRGLARRSQPSTPPAA